MYISYMYIYMYVYIHTCIHTYTHTYTYKCRMIRDRGTQVKARVYLQLNALF